MLRAPRCVPGSPDGCRQRPAPHGPEFRRWAAKPSRRQGLSPWAALLGRKLGAVRRATQAGRPLRRLAKSDGNVQDAPSGRDPSDFSVGSAPNDHSVRPRRGQRAASRRVSRNGAQTPSRTRSGRFLDRTGVRTPFRLKNEVDAAKGGFAGGPYAPLHGRKVVARGCRRAAGLSAARHESAERVLESGQGRSPQLNVGRSWPGGAVG